ncbi:hypothetical protein GS511_17770 [Leptospira borgpetersenii]|uniref:Uncharacterized protein n=4 Tax=Leptospira borgpetersenii TaxID=174 RepID=M3FH70_LEPBO|nr:hypothetical protein LBBP_04289 [Leptospira borgpetersenii serovar Ballum]EKP12046.1 hypothetical protein LEP1GSC128_0425 [Leptospira borgpetersenii str. 200801926]EKR01145.1 hypothetical protein LEP1GSC121_1375 [Leptospira borgpetersenii serovar Castellonis str. 200801910]EMG01198.1 hypothetical protein LEP1GSC123_0943 [Leptospira borgpetersenii str. 200701203]EMO08724.1 hypothetical protein LEP1GSC137_0066 [Leptospira borgpetersenii str. Noumea 25]ENO63141.1 hypothetical protein LEP1GSC19
MVLVFGVFFWFYFHRLLRAFWMFYGDFVSKFFSLDSILFALFAFITLFLGRLFKIQRLL